MSVEFAADDEDFFECERVQVLATDPIAAAILLNDLQNTIDNFLITEQDQKTMSQIVEQQNEIITQQNEIITRLIEVEKNQNA